MDLDMALREDEPPKPTNESTETIRAHYAKWERSNCLSLISIKRSIAKHLLGGIPESNNAKEFLVVVANRYQTSDNVEAGHFMDELMNMSHDDMKGVHSWWLDSGATIHVATSLHGIRNLRKPSEKESKLKVGSDIGIDVEHIGIVVLELDSENANALEMFKVFRTKVEKQLGIVIKIVRSDRGGEYYGKHGDAGQQKGPFARYLQDNSIVAQYTMPGSPEQNGVVERRNRTLMEMKRNMMGRSNLPKYLRGEAIKIATYILNRVPSKSVPSKSVPETPFELWTDRKPNLNHFKVWGCPIEVKIYDPSLKKTDSRTTRCYFIGYPSHSK
ncbi:uncharacterized protein LOC117921944 [Vitis riparia]|uniref:uncharacterized protein LOC117921944 n=1 Tax=Vitis riparia TaxID=96939 RepID=UPI00155A9140|nr:uncharacterized protein LOC117921944 [Vitis riparia]